MNKGEPRHVDVLLGVVMEKDDTWPKERRRTAAEKNFIASL
jgi:hypothetical protein